MCIQSLDRGMGVQFEINKTPFLSHGNFSSREKKLKKKTTAFATDFFQDSHHPLELIINFHFSSNKPGFKIGHGTVMN